MKLLNGRFFVSAGVLLASALMASAIPQLRLSDGVVTVLVTDQGPGDSNPTVGIVGYSGPVGAIWIQAVSTGISKPHVGSPGFPEIDLDSLVLSQEGAVGSLIIELTDTGFTANGNLTASIGGTTDGNVALQTWVDPGNAPFAQTTLVASQGPYAGPSFANNFSTPLSVNVPYSITLRAVINHLGTGGPGADLTGFDAFITVTPTPPLRPGDTATIGFWHNKNGQALIKALPNSPALGNWLGANFPCLFGNLAGKSNADVAAQFKTYFGVSAQNTYAQILAAAFATYVTDSDLAGGVAQNYGFNVSPTGTGARVYNVGSLGTVLGLQNNTDYTVFQLLQAANANCPFNQAEFNALNTIFSDINETGGRL